MNDHAPQSSNTHGNGPGHGQGGGPSVDVLVQSPRYAEPRPFTFAKSSRVGDSAQLAASDLGYVSGTPTFQNAAGDLLDRTKTIAAEHVKDGDVLELVDVGGGV